MGKAKQLESRSRRDSRHVNPNSKCNKRRIRWTQKLHQRFEDAVAALGGAGVATPKEILELMKAPEVTIMHVKSHLQKYRLTSTGGGSGQNKYSGSEEQVSIQDQPAGRLLGIEAFADAHAGEDGYGTDYDALGPELEDVDLSIQVPPEEDDAPQPSGTDQTARENLVDTLVQQHAMQAELKHQIRV